MYMYRYMGDSRILLRYIYQSDTFWKLKNAENSETMKFWYMRAIEMAIHFLQKVLDRYIYRSDTFWKLKNAKNIETINLLKTRWMKVALPYF
jgi:hypothetical protein